MESRKGYWIKTAVFFVLYFALTFAAQPFWNKNNLLFWIILGGACVLCLIAWHYFDKARGKTDSTTADLDQLSLAANIGLLLLGVIALVGLTVGTIKVVVMVENHHFDLLQLLWFAPAILSRAAYRMLPKKQQQ